jgi:DNA polymerase I
MEPYLLVDAETFLYRAAAASEYETEWATDEWTYLCRHKQARTIFEEGIERLADATPSHHVVLCFGNGQSFRKEVFPRYKSNRKNVRKPAGYWELVAWVQREALRYDWLVRSFPNLEGDDVVGLLLGEWSIVASSDKDLRTLPGLHLMVGEISLEVIEVSQEEADRALFTQALTGDAGDGYPGCPTVGAVKAAKILNGCTGEEQLWRATLGAFLAQGLTEDDAITQVRCARILRPGEYDHRNDYPALWSPPIMRRQ